MGAAASSSAAGSHPGAGTSEKSLPGPASHDPTPPGPFFRLFPAPSAPRRTAAAVKRSLPDNGEDRRTLARREQPPS